MNDGPGTQHQESSPSAPRTRRFQRHSVTGPSAEILRNADGQLEELRVRRRATSSFSFDEIPLTMEQIEEIEDAREEDASCLRAGEFTFFERAVRGRIEDEYWRSHRLMPAKENAARRHLQLHNVTVATHGENDGGAGEPTEGGEDEVGLVGQQGSESGKSNSGGGESANRDDEDVGPGDAGDDWMREKDPNEHGNTDEPVHAIVTPKRPKLRAVCSMSAPHVKREALPLDSAEKGFIDRKRGGDELAAIAQFRYMHLALKREEWLESAHNALDKAFTLDDIRGTNVKSVDNPGLKKRRLE